MTPEEFICKHITEKLVAEGFPEIVARGGHAGDWITTAVARRPAAKERCLMIACFVRGNGHLVRQILLSERKRKSRAGLRWACPACPDLPSESTFKELFRDKRPINH
ncbi:hypothetical protein [Escherichia coli]|uniref:hypothetical protein n=1 Tax=Escherichia coli TaxID=562 RepID=UPI001302511C|nr:hypothetical protein [Escherichia coli]KAE9749626.1 hypothetical protein GP704_02605 [Escherichia coli]